MIDHRALLDELVKIGESTEQGSQNRDRMVGALKTIGLASLGAVAGHGAADLMGHAFPKFMQATKPVQAGAVKAVQIGLPILGALSLSLGSKYREKVTEGLSGSSPSNVRRT